MTRRTHAGYNRIATQRHSIRDELEQIARAQNPEFNGHPGHRSGEAKQPQNSCQKSRRRYLLWQDRILLLLSLLLVLLLVVRAETAIAAELPWGLLLKDDSGEYTELAIDTGIQIDITGLVARVEITQHFNNRGSRWAEGTYRFPLPSGAAVDRMYIKVGERILEGEIQENEIALQNYQDAREAGQTATIVQQQRRNQFETSLANIGPGETIAITISYLQNVSYNDLSYHLRLPMTFTPRWEPPRLEADEQVAINPSAPLLVTAPAVSDHHLQLQARLVSAMELAAIESRYHDVDIRRVGNGYSIELSNADVVTDRDFELSWTPALQSGPSASLTTFNDGDSVYAQLMLAPPLAESIRPKPREVILIIDTSGSMEGDSLRQAKAALLHALQSLGPDDYFNLLQFNSDTEQLFDQSEQVTRANLYRAQNFISGLDANGGTDMAPALQIALATPELPHLIRQVVFITDGAVGNESELLQKVAQDLGNSRMFTVAIGHAPNSWFMRKAAEIGRGSFIHIGKPEEVEERMSALWARIRLPALTNLCVEWGDNAEYFPEVIPDLYAGEPLWLIARLPAEPTMIGLCGELDGAAWNLNINGWDAAAGDTGGDNLAKLWARNKIEALEDGLMFGADRELTQLEITDVALDYGLISRYTSLIAVDKTPRRDRSGMLASTEIPGLLPAGSAAHLAGFPSTATGWLAQLLLSLFVLVLSTCMLVFSGSHLPMAKSSTRAAGV